MALYKRGNVWCTNSFFNGECIRESTQFSNRRAAEHIDEDLIESYKRLRTAKLTHQRKPLSPGSVNRDLATLRRLLRMGSGLLPYLKSSSCEVKRAKVRSVERG